MSTPKRATVYFEPEVYQALRVRALAVHRPMSELVNAAVRSALIQEGAKIGGLEQSTEQSMKGARASHERLVQALKRRRLLRHRARPQRS